MVTIGLVLFGLALGSPLIIFVDASATIIVVGGTFFLMLAAHGTSTVSPHPS
jgi:flagellar motor component MotA